MIVNDFRLTLWGGSCTYAFAVSTNRLYNGIVQCMKQQSTFKMWQLYETELRHLYWYQNTLWSKGYFYCSIGDVSTKIIEQYIENQG